MNAASYIGWRKSARAGLWILISLIGAGALGDSGFTCYPERRAFGTEFDSGNREPIGATCDHI